MIKKEAAPTSPSQEAMLEHIAYLVFCERRAACWRDFQDFEVGGKKYRLKAGTIRNNLSKLRRQDKIVVAYRSIDSYYTLSGYRAQKSGTMTADRARVYKPDLGALIRRMVFDMPSAHDIHLRFTVYGIWKTLSVLSTAFPAARSSAADSYNRKTLAVNIITNAAYSATTSHELLAIRSISKDLVVPVMALESGIQGRITIHKNDTVSVILSCSESPIRFDIGGLVTLTCSLARLEERLRSLIDDAQERKRCRQMMIS